MMWIFEWDILTGDSAVLDVISSVTGRPGRRGGRRGPRGGRRRRADAHPGRRHRPGHLARPGDAAGVPRHPRLRGRHPRAAGRVPRAGAAAGPVARHRVVAGPRAVVRRPRAVPRRSRHPTSSATRATSTTRPTTSPPPSSVSAAASATRRWRGSRAACSRSPWAGSSPGRSSRSAVAAGRRGRRPPRTGSPPPARGGRPRSAPGMPRAQRALLVAVPGALLLATRAVQTSFLAPVHLLVVLGAWLVLVGVGWALLRGRVPWGVVAAAGGVLVARCALALLAMSSTGPGRLLVRVLDRAGPAHGVRHRRRGPVPVAARGGRLGALGHHRAPPGGRHRARRGRRGPGRAGIRDRPRRPRAGPDGVERPGRAAAVGALAHPRHHGLPRHPRPTPRGGRPAWVAVLLVVGSAARAPGPADPRPRVGCSGGCRATT